MGKHAWLGLLLCAVVAACSPDVDVYAPERELYVVYGVLNPKSSKQYVTITKVYQVEGDALLYASQNDLTARNMRVRLRSDSTYWDSQLVEKADSVPNLFSLTTGAYEFETAGPTALKEGHRYALEITKPDDPNFLITAYTDIPTAPVLTFPGPPSYFAPLQEYSFPEVEFGDEQAINFHKGSGKGWEVRVYIQYTADQVEHVSFWGPTAVFKSPVGCNVSVQDGCFTIPAKSVSNELHSILAAYPDTVDFVDTIRHAHTIDSLNKTAWVEVTAVDSFLTTYLVVNNPFGFGLNLLMDKQEYTNISGSNIGIFGSINTHKRYIFLGSCTKYLSGLREPLPGNCVD